MTIVRRSPLATSILVTVIGFLVLGLLVGWLWSVLADPSSFTVTNDNGVMDEVESAKQFGVTVTFTWLSAVAALAWSTLCSWRFAALGWPHVVSTAAGAAAASAIAWRLGVLLGPSDPVTAIKTAKVGTLVPTRLVLDSHGVLLVWPVVALIALILVVTWFVPETPADPHGI